MSGTIDYIKNRYEGFIKRPEQRGISGWVFDIVDEDGINLSADITDHVTESGTESQDHVVIKADRVTMRGFIGELVYYGASNEIERVAQAARDRLGAIGAFPGAETIQAAQKAEEVTQQAAYVAGQASALLKRAKNIVDTVRGEGTEETKQQKAFQDLDALFRERIPVEVETPWKFYPAMLIESIDTVQTGESKYISEISITLKEYREAGTKTFSYAEGETNMNEIQSAEDQTNGKIDGVTAGRDSFLYKAVETLGG